MFTVRLEGGRSVRAGLDSKARHAIVRLLPGDRVLVRVSAVDPSRGQVVKKL
jgi:translation initiation factor IF-1